MTSESTGGTRLFRSFRTWFFAFAIVGSMYGMTDIPSAHAATNLIQNPGFETASPTSSTTPSGWGRGRWGTNTAVFSYPVTSGDGSRAAKVTLSSYTSGDAKWYFSAVPVTPGHTYTYTDSYSASVPTVVTLAYTMSDGTTSYPDLGTVPASSGWSSSNFSFTVPSGATAVTVFHLINQNGTLTIDNVSLTDSTPAQTSLINNPSLENAGTGGNPAGWFRGRWGTNTTSFSYPITGHTGKGASVTISSYSSGDAKWYFTNVPANQSAYQFSDYYKSTVATDVTVQFTSTGGVLSYLDIGTAPASSNWTQFQASFNVPAGTASFTVFHVINSVGTLSVDDFDLVPSAPVSDPTKFDKGYVSINFDDGYLSSYENALPILDAAGFNADDFLVTGYINGQFPDYVSRSDVADIQSRGYEIGAHTRTHSNLTTLTTADAQSEIAGSRQDLFDMGASPVNYFAYPFGAYNSQVQQLVKNAGFLAARSSDGGYNDKTTDLYALRRQPMVNTTTFAQVKGYIDTAIANKTWVILLFHEVDNTGNQYAVTPALFQQIVNYLAQQGITPITISQGVAKMKQ